MKILLLGDITGHIDEGMKNTTFYFKRALEKNHEVMVVHPRDSIKSGVLKKIKIFMPDVIHYIHGPTPKSFIATKILSLLNPHALTVMSVPKPTVSVGIKKWIVSLLKPHVFLLQSRRNETVFKKSGARVEYLYPGVDLEKFQPVPGPQKKLLRDQYGIDNNKFVVLHVGHITPQRGLKILCDIQKKFSRELQVIVAGALTIESDEQISKTLQDAGCIVWLKYFERIGELYQLSDCYIFPGMHETSAIEIPLTVLEAMACNLPVITDRFGGLPDLFQKGDGLYFVSNEGDLHKALQDLLQNTAHINTIEKVRELSWKNVVTRLVTIYERYYAGK